MKQQLSEINLITQGTRLSIVARHIVDGFLIGLHRGTRRGTGSEFSQFRSYQPGDDIRQVDWKMYARSDRYYIKEAETESSVTVRFFLDASASMNYTENSFSRFTWSALSTAALGTLAHKQGDAIALHIVNNETRLDLSPKRGKNQLYRFYSLLESAECSGKWPESTDWITDIMNSRRRELWIVCSDMLDGTEPWKSFTDTASAFGHEIQFLQILGGKELNLSLEDVVTVQDPESNQKLNIRTESVRDEYLENLKTYRKALAKAVISKKSNLHLLRMDTPVNRALQLFLEQRKRI